MIIDFHTHVFPQKVASKAIAKLSRASGGIPPAYDGTPDGLLRCMDANSIDKSVALSIATSPSQMHAVNDFAASIANDRIIPFGSVHPDAPGCVDELERISSLGMRGIKLHPDYQTTYVDDEKMFPIYEKAARLGLIVSFHAGMDIGLYSPVYLTPSRMLRALPYLQGATVVLAHFGGYLLWEEALDKLCGLDLFLDTSYSAGRIPPPLAAAIIKKHGAHKILFGTDAPWGKPNEEVSFVHTLDLSDGEKTAILSGNAQALLTLY